MSEDYRSMEKFVEFMKQNHDQSNYINWEIPITICSSAAGHFVGQTDPEDGAPLCRLSTEYWPTQEKAQEALDTFRFYPRFWL